MVHWRLVVYKIFFVLLVMLSGMGGHGREVEPEAVEKFKLLGFPADYAVKLAFLHKKHPNWQFRALYISRLNPLYTWQYVLYMESDKAPSRSLVSGNRIFEDYFHKSDLTIYDANCRRASTAAVAYFLDPRNFLNERDIFQFVDLSFNKDIPLEAVQSALKGTFMARGKLEDGRSYAQWLYELGSKFNVDPLFLASRVRQEQGAKGTPLISGKCGDVLADLYFSSGGSRVFKGGIFELKLYNGLYNFFNIDASGNGRFTIYLNGMREAQKGNPEMSKVWGSPAWNCKWKALYGGSEKIASRYIYNYQNTLYLQKWNVDFRSRSGKGNSRNFWGQYMQNIGGAFSESRTTYNSLAKNGLLEEKFLFLIPVYSSMPEKVSPDPGNGKCKYYRSFDYNENIVIRKKSPEKTKKQTDPWLRLLENLQQKSFWQDIYWNLYLKLY